MKREEIETLARFAAAALSGPGDEPLDRALDDALSSFSDPAEVRAIARRAWEELAANGGFIDEETPCSECGVPGCNLGNLHASDFAHLNAGRNPKG